ncbi:MAG: TetR/AcrR family transcriptional regulator [Alphaproteobacteria bacterium]|nr:MAG: TetR/AcrR family transcriptional regulator [Alphaproteobacteria bacterium]
MAKPAGSNKENFERTRAHLLAVATACFARHGFHGASTNMVVREARSSRGSLYHHFPDKQAMFKAVYDSLCKQLADRIATYPYEGVDPLEDLIAGCLAYLRVFTDQAFARIMLMDGPLVLGIEYCRSWDMETAYKALHEGVIDILGPGEQAPVVTDYLSGALDTYALRIATAEDRDHAYHLYAPAFADLTKRLFTLPAHGRDQEIASMVDLRS